MSPGAMPCERVEKGRQPGRRRVADERVQGGSQRDMAEAAQAPQVGHHRERAGDAPWADASPSE